MQGNCAVAAILCGSSIGVITTGCVGLTIPCICITSIYSHFCLNALVDGQIEYHNAITTFCGDQSYRVFGACCICLTIEIPTIAVACGLLEFNYLWLRLCQVSKLFPPCCFFIILQTCARDIHRD